MADLTVDDLLGITCRTDLSPSARIAYMYLLRETYEGRRWPSFTQLAVVLGLRERRTRDLLRELVEAGEIHLDDGGRAIFPAVAGAPIRRVTQETATTA